MIQEAINQLVELGRAELNSKKAQIFSVPGDGRTVVVEHNGELTDRQIPPHTRDHHVHTVSGLTDAAKRWPKNNVIWICPTQAVLIIDDDDRRDRVTLILHETATFAFLRSLKTKGGFTQPELIRLLRIELVNTAGRAQILTAVRKIKFRNHLSGASDIQHGNESMGQQIENEVTGADAIPDNLTVQTAVHSNLGETDYEFSVALDLEIDAKNQKFVLRPICDEIERVAQAALAGIAERISKAIPDVSVFFGEP